MSSKSPMKKSTGMSIWIVARGGVGDGDGGSGDCGDDDDGCDGGVDCGGGGDAERDVGGEGGGDGGKGSARTMVVLPCSACMSLFQARWPMYQATEAAQAGGNSPASKGPGRR